MLDHSIIEKCIQGHREAQEALYNYYASRLKGVCIRYTKSPFEAEDLFQEAFIKVFSNLKNFKMEGSFDGWIRRIVINTAIDYYKKNLIFTHQVNYENVAEEALSPVPMPNDLDEADLLKILNQLPDGYKVIFNLYAIEGFSHKEIAEMLKISEGTSKSQLSKARRYIQALLQKTHIAENETRAI